MGFRIVIFAEFAIGIGARRIEIAQRREVRSVRSGIPVEDLLHGQLRFTVRVDRLLRVVIRMGTSCGTPYVAHVDEKTISRTPASTIASSKLSVQTTLLRKYFRGL